MASWLLTAWIMVVGLRFVVFCFVIVLVVCWVWM